MGCVDTSWEDGLLLTSAFVHIKPVNTLWSRAAAAGNHHICQPEQKADRPREEPGFRGSNLLIFFYHAYNPGLITVYQCIKWQHSCICDCNYSFGLFCCLRAETLCDGDEHCGEIKTWEKLSRSILEERKRRHWKYFCDVFKLLWGWKATLDFSCCYKAAAAMMLSWSTNRHPQMMSDSWIIQSAASPCFSPFHIVELCFLPSLHCFALDFTRTTVSEFVAAVNVWTHWSSLHSSPLLCEPSCLSAGVITGATGWDISWSNEQKYPPSPAASLMWSWGFWPVTRFSRGRRLISGLWVSRWTEVLSVPRPPDVCRCPLFRILSNKLKVSQTPWDCAAYLYVHASYKVTLEKLLCVCASLMTLDLFHHQLKMLNRTEISRDLFTDFKDKSFICLPTSGDHIIMSVTCKILKKILTHNSNCINGNRCFWI